MNELNTSTLCPSTLPSVIITIHGTEGPLVVIHNDGTMTFGANYVPTEAAKIFWEALASAFPGSFPGNQMELQLDGHASPKTNVQEAYHRAMKILD